MDPSFARITISLLGGLALFLLGMNLMATALNNLAGDRMKRLIARVANNRFTAALTGTVATAVIQSSSVTTVLLVGFTSAGIMTISQSVGVIFGANLGSTITAQIIAFKITEAGAPLLFVGLVASMFRKNARFAEFGTLILGLGAIFFGMHEMADATRPLRSYEPFLEAMRAINNPLVGALVGMVFTAIVQSSAATIGIIIIFSTQGFVTLEGGIALTLGANVGTCITAALAAIGRPTSAWRVAFIHIIFNLAGSAIWLGLIPQLASISETVCATVLQDNSIARKIAMAHTLFNAINLLLFIGFTRQLASLATRLILEKPKTVEATHPIYLDKIFLDTPSMAIDRARMETARLATYAIAMAEEIPLAAMQGSAMEIAQLSKRDDEIDELQTAILSYLARIDADNLSKSDKHSLQDVISLVTAWENIGDILDSHVLPTGLNRLDTGLDFSPQTKTLISNLHKMLIDLLHQALVVTSAPNELIAQQILSAKHAYNHQAEEAERSLANRLSGRDEARLEIFRMESDLIGNLKRIHYFARRIAKMSLDTNAS